MTYVKTILDPELDAKRAERSEQTRLTQQEHAKALAVARQQFDNYFRTCRRGRPEYDAMAAGVKAELPDDAMELLAVSAGFSLGEVSELKTLRKRGQFCQAEAATLSERKKAAAAAEKTYRRLDSEFSTATTRPEQDRLEGELLSASEAWAAARVELAGAESRPSVRRNGEGRGRDLTRLAKARRLQPLPAGRGLRPRAAAVDGFHISRRRPAPGGFYRSIFTRSNKHD